MSGRRLAAIACPHARPEDGCKLVPGVRYCVCHSGEERDTVASVVVRDGQLFWVVRGEGGRELGGYGYVAVVPRAAGLETLELEGEVELRVRQDADGRKPTYIVRGRNQVSYEIDAVALVDAANDGREYLECRVHDASPA